MNNLEFKSVSSKEEVCKWINQYQNLIDVSFITYDSLMEEFVIFFRWKSKE